MRVGVLHNTLNSVGGGERVCLTVIKTLKDMGFETVLMTVEPTDWQRVEKIVGDVVKPDYEVSLAPFKVRAFGIYMRLLTVLLLGWKRGRWDLIINTHGDVLPVSSDIIYMHFPTFALLRETPVNVKYSESLFWRMYFFPYEKAQSWLAKRIKWRVLLTNSEFSREVIKRQLGFDAIVVYPPVEINEFLRVGENRDREDRVVLCGRYSPEKNYETAVKVASRLPDVKFTIIGAYSGKISKAYYAKLRRIKERLGAKNIELLRNVPREKQLEIYSRSKVFMHCMEKEHFGIAIVEGMAAGLVPVVHRSGGPWLDIIARGRYGYGYRDINEAVEAIRKALENYEDMRELAVERAMQFHENNFIRRFREIVEKLVSEK